MGCPTEVRRSACALRRLSREVLRARRVAGLHGFPARVLSLPLERAHHWGPTGYRLPRKARPAPRPRRSPRSLRILAQPPELPHLEIRERPEAVDDGVLERSEPERRLLDKV